MNELMQQCIFKILFVFDMIAADSNFTGTRSVEGARIQIFRTHCTIYLESNTNTKKMRERSGDKQELSLSLF